MTEVAPLTYSQTELSALFGHEDPDWFPTNRDKLITDYKFPTPIPKPGQKRWSRVQVDRWFATAGQDTTPEEGPDDEPDNGGALPSDWTKTLLARLDNPEAVR